MNLKLSSVPYLSTFLHSSITVPKQWINDIKLVEFEELLSSSVSALALVFRWNKVEKTEFTEIASGMLSSSFVYGDPIGTIGSIAALGYTYTKTKQRNFKKNEVGSNKRCHGCSRICIIYKINFNNNFKRINWTLCCYGS